MTTTVSQPVPATAADADPFRYGWRIVRRDLGDGYFDEELVPLRLIDLLHPEEGDQVLCNYDHQRRVRYLANVFLAASPTVPTPSSSAMCASPGTFPTCAPTVPT
jgi:colicin import membrane protein